MKYAQLDNNNNILTVQWGLPLEIKDKTEIEQRANGWFKVVELGLEGFDSSYHNITSETKTVNGLAVEINYTYTDKDLTDIKEKMISDLKTNTAAELSKTDWAIIRFVDTSTPVPTAIKDERDNIRAISNQIETSILLSNTLNELKNINTIL